MRKQIPLLSHLQMRRMFFLALATAAVLTIGTLGFILIEGWSTFDAFYMTVITMTTVGYNEMGGLSTAGRVFNVFLMGIGVSVVFFGIAVLTQTIVELQLEDGFGQRRQRKMINHLKNHYVICGFGRVGRGAAEQLQRAQVPFVVVDNDKERVERARRYDMLAVEGDITQDEVLEEVGIQRAKGLVAALATDADNAFLILSAKTLQPALNVAARVANEETQNRMRMAGADVVLAPYASTGHRLAQALIRPHVVEFLEIPGTNESPPVSMEQVQVGPTSTLASRTLEEARIRHDYGVIVLAIRRSDGKMVFNPQADTKIQASDHLIVIGEPEGLRRLESSLGQGETQPV